VVFAAPSSLAIHIAHLSQWFLSVSTEGELKEGRKLLQYFRHETPIMRSVREPICLGLAGCLEPGKRMHAVRIRAMIGAAASPLYTIAVPYAATPSTARNIEWDSGPVVAFGA
jgi:hypothetical protein